MFLISDNRGFTLIELVVVIAIMAIMSVIALPQIKGMLGDEREESAILKAYIETVADDSFTRRKSNFLCIHLSKQGEKNNELFDDSFNETNIVNVYEFQNGRFIKNKNKLLKDRSFNSSFNLSEVIIDNAKIINSGNVLIPFYSDGTSTSFTLKIISKDHKIILTKNRVSKTVKIENEI